MELFSSTSPSYLILQSLDRANEYIDNGYAEKLDSFIGRVEKLKQTLVQNGFDIVGDEPLKLTVAPKRYGYTGEQLADMLLRNNVVCEFADADYCVMMLTPETNGQEINRLEELLLDMEKKRPLTETPPMPEYAHRAMSVREAMLSDSVEVAACEAAGKILASPSVSCPPAVPIVMCGEKIDNAAVNCFEYYRIKRVTVVKE